MSQHIPDEENELAHGLDVTLKDVIIRTAVPFFGWLPTPTRFYINRMVKQARELQARLFAHAMRDADDPGAPKTMLSEMLRMRKGGADADADAAGLTDSEIGDELQTIRAAGHETTSNTLCWAMLLLAQNPRELERLRREADEVVAGDVPTYEEAKRLHRHHSAVLETLRLFPTVPSFPRECHRDTVMRKSGYDIPRGSYVFVSQRALNRFGWDRPDEFVPDRFDSVQAVSMSLPVGDPSCGAGADARKYAFAPFGASTRSCIGSRIAMIEAVMALGAVTKTVEWRLAFPDRPVAEVADVTLGPKSSGLWLDVWPRP